MKCKFVQEAHDKLGGKGEMVVYIACLLYTSEHRLRGVVLEQQETVEAALQTGVGVDEFVHQLRVAPVSYTHLSV